MAAIDVLIAGLVLGGMYALVAMGLTLQYGVARIMNLSYGEVLVAASFGAYVLVTELALSPVVALAASLPAGFAVSWLVYRVLLTPLVRRTGAGPALEVDGILATFGLLFIVQGVMLAAFGGGYYSYEFLSVPVDVLGAKVAANRLIALGFAAFAGIALYLALTRTRIGTAIRAVAVAPRYAPLVAIDVQAVSALAFGAGGALAAAGGALVSMFLPFSAGVGVVFTMKALVVVVMGGVGNLLGCLVAGLMLGFAETLVARYVDPGLTLAANYALFLLVLFVRPAGLFGRGGAMSARAGAIALGTLALVAAAAVPWLAGDYGVSFGINLLQFGVMATAWGLFSGPTRLVSLATVAFFGTGAYTVAVAGEALPWIAVLAIALGLGVALALVVGFATLRLSGVHFVIFTFGLAELVKQLVTWYEVNVTRSIGRYVFLDITQREIYLQLLALLALVLVTGWAIRRSRLGLALRVIGADETVARHVGINPTFAKQVLFAISAGFIALTGAMVAPRWTYLDPVIAFSPTISFEVVIMALLGGAARLTGPLAGVIPIVILFELLSARFPNTFPIVLGVTFLLIVYALPDGVAGALERLRRRGRAPDGTVTP